MSSVLVNPHNEQEEKVLLAFLDSLRYDYKPNIESNEKVIESFLDQYNLDQYNKIIEEDDADIEAGNYTTQDEVKKFFAERRKTIEGNPDK